MEVCFFFFFFLKTLHGVSNILSFWIFALSVKEIFSETPGGLWLCPLAMYSSIWEGGCAATYKLFICVDVCFLSLPVQKKERTKQMFEWFWRHARVLCGPVLCNHQYHNLNVIFCSRCYSCHPCFLLYYGISEWCQVLYMVWIYVCKEEMWESVQEDALFLLWNILSLLISKQELCLFLLLWFNACI